MTTHVCIHIPVLHTTPTSLLWLQLWTPHPRCWHWCSDDSLPVHLTLSSQIGPDPRPKYLKLSAPLNPSCLHATFVWDMFHVRLHIVPHWPLWYICKIPWTSDGEDVLRCNLNGVVPTYKEIVMTYKRWFMSADVSHDDSNYDIWRHSLITFKTFIYLYSTQYQHHYCASSNEHPILGVGTDLVTFHCHYNLLYWAKLDPILVLSTRTSLHVRSQAVYTLHLCQSCPSSYHILFPIDHCDKSVKYLAVIAEWMFCTATSMALFL